MMGLTYVFYLFSSICIISVLPYTYINTCWCARCEIQCFLAIMTNVCTSAPHPSQYKLRIHLLITK
jgi:hypothetical protein